MIHANKVPMGYNLVNRSRKSLQGDFAIALQGRDTDLAHR